MKEQIKWNTTSGKEVTVEVELLLSKTINLDGDIDTVPCCEMKITAMVDGLGVVGTGAPEPVGNAKASIECVSRLGKLGIAQVNHDRIMAAIAKVESTPEWIAKVAKIEANRRDNAKLNATRKANGYCPKCGSYCHGDCSAN